MMYCVPSRIIIREYRALFVIVCGHAALLLAMGLFRHWGNMSNLNDLGFFDQAVWGTLHGQWFLDTNNVYGRPINWLCCHFNVFLLLFVPLYALRPAAEWFAVVQALALSLAAWPIFLLARRVHGSGRTALLWACIYLFNPFLLNAAAWDFHPVTIAVPFIATALLAVEKNDFRLLFACCVLLLLIQEQCGITVAGFGALWGLKHRDWKKGLLLTGTGLLHTILVLGFIMPALSPSGAHSMIDPGSRGSRYGWMGGSLFEILSTGILHPVRMVTTVVSMDGAISYYVLLALPLAGLFIAAPVWLLPSVADFAANTLSSVSMPRELISYHSVTLVPILTVAAMYGARRMAPQAAHVFSIPLSQLVLLLTLGLGYLSAPLPLPGAMNFWRPSQWIQLPDPTFKQLRTVVDNGASLSVQANVGAHFSQRREVYRYPYKAGETDSIVLWLASPTLGSDPRNGHGIGSLAHHLQMKPAAYLASVECLLQNPAYGVVLWNEPWLVASRGPQVVNADRLIRGRLEALRRSWQISSTEYEAALQTCRNI
ncbi:MAG: DUF2079 domain-containing protein [Desulfuromonadales bacterium]